MVQTIVLKYYNGYHEYTFNFDGISLHIPPFGFPSYPSEHLQVGGESGSAGMKHSEFSVLHTTPVHVLSFNC